MNKKKAELFAAFAVIAVLALGLGAAVYAKYVSQFTKTGSATVAKWAFTTDNSSGSVTCTLDATYDSSTLVAEKIAPGTSGKCPIQVSNANTEVGVHYEIVPSATSKPINLKFYIDADHETEITDSVKLDGNLTPNEAAKTVYVYWYWAFEGNSETYDTDDTTAGTNASANGMTMTFDVTGTQIQPVGV